MAKKPPIETASRANKRRYLFGILILLVVVFIWVATSFVTNSIFGDQDFERPFFITYYSTSTFSVYFIPFALRYLSQAYITRLQSSSSTFTDTTANLIVQTNEEELTERLLDESRDNDYNDDDEINSGTIGSDDGQVRKMSLRETVHLSAYFCILWFLANYCTNASLAYTTVGSSTILSSMSGLFTLIFGVLLRVERFQWMKIFSVAISFVGVILVSWSDQIATTATPADAQDHNKLTGDLFALAGAMVYGVYTVLLKFRIGDESRIDMSAFFGFVGLFNIILLWPFFFILHWTGVEPFSFPPNSTLWTMISLNAFIGTFLSDYLWLLAMLMTSPLVVTLGITLTVPLALIGDVVFKHILPGVQYVAGACFVVAGFFAVNLGSLKDKELCEEEDEQHEMIPCEDF